MRKITAMQICRNCQYSGYGDDIELEMLLYGEDAFLIPDEDKRDAWCQLEECPFILEHLVVKDAKHNDM